MFILKVKCIKYKVDKMNKRVCIARRLYIAWKANSSLLFADDCWCGCSLWQCYTYVEVGWLDVVITVVSVVFVFLFCFILYNDQPVHN
jgi:hypothetical protein